MGILFKHLSQSEEENKVQKDIIEYNSVLDECFPGLYHEGLFNNINYKNIILYFNRFKNVIKKNKKKLVEFNYKGNAVYINENGSNFYNKLKERNENSFPHYPFYFLNISYDSEICSLLNIGVLYLDGKPNLNSVTSLGINEITGNSVLNKVICVKNIKINNSKINSEHGLSLNGNINIENIEITDDTLKKYDCSWCSHFSKTLSLYNTYSICGDYHIYDKKSLKRAIMLSNIMQGI